MINVIETEIPKVVIIEPKIFGDNRGVFMRAIPSGSLRRRWQR